MADVDLDATMMEDGSCLQQENAYLRQQITRLTQQLQAAKKDRSKYIAKLKRALDFMGNEKSVVEAEL